jgi:hypothetical protein
MMKIVTTLFAAANYTLAPLLPVSAECGVSNFKIKDTTNNNDERILRKHENKKNDVDKEETQTCDYSSV